MSEMKGPAGMVKFCLYMSIMLLCIGGLSSSFVACGGSPQTEVTGDGGTSGDAGTADTGTKGWPQMSFEEKQSYMTSTVLPLMSKLFKEYNATKYANFSCVTCHGSDMVSRKYAMPNTVYPISDSTLENENASWLAFMRDKIQPEMAKLMGTSQYTCYGCHASK